MVPCNFKSRKRHQKRQHSGWIGDCDGKGGRKAQWQLYLLGFLMPVPRPLPEDVDAQHGNQHPAQQADWPLVSDQKLRHQRDTKYTGTGVKQVGGRGPQARSQSCPKTAVQRSLDRESANGTCRNTKDQANQKAPATTVAGADCFMMNRIWALRWW